MTIELKRYYSIYLPSFALFKSGIFQFFPEAFGVPENLTNEIAVITFWAEIGRKE